jgi:hypothetical protein
MITANYLNLTLQTQGSVTSSHDVSDLYLAVSLRNVSKFEIRIVVGEESDGAPSRAGGATPVSSPCCDSLHLLLGTAYLAGPARLCASLHHRATSQPSARNFPSSWH